MPATKSIDTNGLLYFSSLVKTALAGKVDLSAYNTKQAAQDERLSNFQSALADGIQTIASSDMADETNGLFYVSDIPAIMVVGTDNSKHPTIWLTKDGVLYNPTSPSLATALPYLSVTCTQGADGSFILSIMERGVLTNVVVNVTDSNENNNGLMRWEDKAKLDGIDAGAQVNTIERIMIQGSQTGPLAIDNKMVTIPSSNLASANSTALITSGGVYSAVQSLGAGISQSLSLKADLASPGLTGTPTAPTATAGTNTTQIATTAFVQAALAAAVSGRFKFVSALPASGETGYIYLVPHTHTSGSTSANPDLKDEYVWDADGTSWELIGNTDIDLSSHWSKSELEIATNAEVLAAWNNAAATA